MQEMSNEWRKEVSAVFQLTVGQQEPGNGWKRS